MRDDGGGLWDYKNKFSHARRRRVILRKEGASAAYNPTADNPRQRGMQIFPAQSNTALRLVSIKYARVNIH